MRSRARLVMSYCLFIFTITALASRPATGQIIQRWGSIWVSFRDTGKIYWVSGYETWETFNPKTNIRRVYFRRPGEKNRRLIYKHERVIFLTIGHTGQSVLINDNFTTKACKVATVDIDTGLGHEIDSAANDYSKKANPDPWLIIVPEAQGFSPDDRQVLIHMDLIYISVPTAKEGRSLSDTFNPRWYAVDSVSGRVLHEFRAKSLAREWWNF